MHHCQRNLRSGLRGVAGTDHMVGRTQCVELTAEDDPGLPVDVVLHRPVWVWVLVVVTDGRAGGVTFETVETRRLVCPRGENPPGTTRVGFRKGHLYITSSRTRGPRSDPRVGRGRVRNLRSRYFRAVRSGTRVVTHQGRSEDTLHRSGDLFRRPQDPLRRPQTGPNDPRWSRTRTCRRVTTGEGPLTLPDRRASARSRLRARSYHTVTTLALGGLGEVSSKRRAVSSPDPGPPRRSSRSPESVSTQSEGSVRSDWKGSPWLRE